MNRKQKFAGLFAIIMVVSTLFAGLAVNRVSAAIVFDDTRVTKNAASQENPDIYEYGPIQNISIVYQDNRNGNWDIYMSSYQSYVWQPEVRVTNNSANQVNPKICGDIIVWLDNRNGNWDIYMYNITSQTEALVTNNMANQENLAIDGNYIVWQDDRAGCLGVYMYNLTSHTEQVVQVRTTGYNNFAPAISGNRIAWVETYNFFAHNDESWLRCRDISTGNTQTVESLAYPNYLFSVAISGSRLVWLRDLSNINGKDLSRPILFGVVGVDMVCPDVYGSYMVYQKNNQVYLYDMETESTFKVSNSSNTQMEPRISSQYSNFIVYMDDRNGNWDIYLTHFGYNMLAIPDNTSSGQGLGAVVIISAVVVVVAVVGAVAAVVYLKKRKR